MLPFSMPARERHLHAFRIQTQKATCLEPLFGFRAWILILFVVYSLALLATFNLFELFSFGVVSFVFDEEFRGVAFMKPRTLIARQSLRLCRRHPNSPPTDEHFQKEALCLPVSSLSGFC